MNFAIEATSEAETTSREPRIGSPRNSDWDEGRQWALFVSWMLIAAAIAITVGLAHSQVSGHHARIKDVATVEGIRDNQLVGYGLVVGLRGTGDSSQTVFPAQTLVSALERMGVTVPQTGSNSASNMQVKNMAAVFVVATLPPFSRPGFRVDVTASSAGDARSLEGGILLMTPLYGPDGQIYAQAQGALVLGGYMSSAGGNTRQLNHPTTARIPGGGQVERAVPFEMKQLRTVNFILNQADFHTAEEMARARNVTPACTDETSPAPRLPSGKTPTTSPRDSTASVVPIAVRSATDRSTEI